MDIPEFHTADHAAPFPEQQQMLLSTFSSPILQQPTTSAHAMPTPTPNWSMDSMPWKITKSDNTGDVMEFTAHAPYKNNAMRRALLHQKRKSDFNVAATLPVKQFISEEKITAHFNGLHISSDYIQHNTGNTSANDDVLPSTSGKCFSNLTYEDYQIIAKELEEKLRNANRITICEELTKFCDEQKKKVTYLPEALLNHIQKPCTALVLWQPPPPLLNIITQNNGNDNNRNRKNSSDSNCESIEDYTLLDVDLPPEQPDNIDDFIDNNNTCSLDFNNVKVDSMDEDL